jgi:hypothetical protein
VGWGEEGRKKTNLAPLFLIGSNKNGLGRSTDKLVHPGNVILFSIKKKCYQAMKRYGRTLNADYQVKKDNLEKLYTI